MLKELSFWGLLKLHHNIGIELWVRGWYIYIAVIFGCISIFIYLITRSK